VFQDGHPSDGDQNLLKRILGSSDVVFLVGLLAESSQVGFKTDANFCHSHALPRTKN
jgi:hypothetical protein